jgi:HSP90 family molecular chaperone
MAAPAKKMWLAMLLFEKRRLKDLVKKHSELIGFPIALYTEIYEEEWGNQLRRLGRGEE